MTPPAIIEFFGTLECQARRCLAEDAGGNAPAHQLVNGAAYVQAFNELNYQWLRAHALGTHPKDFFDSVRMEHANTVLGFLRIRLAGHHCQEAFLVTFKKFR